MRMFVAFPQGLILLFGEISNRFMNREIEFFGGFDELLFPPDQFFAFPWGHGAFINTEPVSGMTRSGSIPSTWLNPSQVGQAP